MTGQYSWATGTRLVAGTWLNILKQTGLREGPPVNWTCAVVYERNPKNYGTYAADVPARVSIGETW